MPMNTINQRKRKALAKQRIANKSMGPGQRSKIANDQRASTDRSVGKMYDKVNGRGSGPIVI